MAKRRAITQAAARAALKRVAQLEQEHSRRLNSYVTDYPGGVHMATIGMGELSAGRLQASQSLGAAIVGRMDGQEMRVYAILPTAVANG